MVELPSVPSLDVADPSDDGIPIIEEVEATPSAAPAPQAAAPRGPAPARPGTAVVAESVDEILEQATEQMLKLSRLEELIGAVATQQEDLREELHAGVAELRALIEQNARASAAPRGDATPASVERLDQLELQGRGFKGRQTLLTVLVVLQLALLGWLGWRLGGGSGSSGPLGGDSSASYLSAPAQTDGVASIPGSATPEGGAVAPAPEPESGKATKKKRRRKRP